MCSHYCNLTWSYPDMKDWGFSRKVTHNKYNKLISLLLIKCYGKNTCIFYCDPLMLIGPMQVISVVLFDKKHFISYFYH